MKKDLFKKLFKTLLALCLAFGMAVFMPLSGVQAATKPAKPVISVKSDKAGTAVKVTISATGNAEGYLIYMKSDTDTKYKKIKTLKKDGTVARSYTVKKLSAGTYSFKVKAYLKSNGKTVKGSYSRVKTVTLETATDEGDTISISDLSKLKTGDMFTFGSYEQDNDISNGKEPIKWIVLSKTDNEMLVLSKYVLDCQPYNKELVSITWEDCTLRTWLNDEFYANAFNKTEQGMIKTKTIENFDNANYGTPGGNDTKDKVFLLSQLEFTNSGLKDDYYAGDKNGRGVATPYAIAKGAFCYIADDGERVCDWWLRSPGYIDLHAAYVSTIAGIISSGSSVKVIDYGVRPALYINLNP
ncbi:MAG: DUF6273 domain-containing protein [Lachnospiraceae bacterium]|nr:DUF6273 domain-containing protein [Lachnospiraceae bacterium]